VMLGAVGTFTISSLGDVVTSVNDLGRRSVLLQGSLHVKADFLQQLAYIRNYILFGDSTSLDKIEDAQTRVYATLDDMYAHAQSQETFGRIQKLRSLQEQYDAVLDSVEAQVRSKDTQAAAAILQSQGVPLMESILEECELVVERQMRLDTEERATMLADAQRMRITILVTVGLALVGASSWPSPWRGPS